MPSVPLGRRRARTFFLCFLTLVVIALIAASPWALRAFGGPTARWERLSFIGQTYGAASALLAALALIGIAATLIFQAHDTKIAREEARRIAIAELLKMAMDDPALDEAWGPVPADADPRARRQLMYINMIISEWQMSFETKALPEKRLRAISRDVLGPSWPGLLGGGASGPHGHRREQASAPVPRDLGRGVRAGTPSPARATAHTAPMEVSGRLDSGRSGAGPTRPPGDRPPSLTDRAANHAEARRRVDLKFGWGFSVGPRW
ncbi:DUF6082 family protein [Spirillospora sp. CA-108201]